MAKPKKSWDRLSENYRRRLERSGVTREQHASGQPLHKARGHKSGTYEREQQKTRKGVARWITEYSKVYGRDEDDVIEALAEFPKAKVWSAIQKQTTAQQLYHDGRVAEAHEIWEQRDRSLPDWMHYYHGYFS